ncbi:MAG: response regulator [Magnetococcales bacterium]|nr:response regulator [Magnetococcales bacterium]
MKKLLIIEDDLDLAQLYRETLELDGWQVTSVETCKEALFRLVRKDYPEVIFLDLNLPDCHGLEILELIEKEKIPSEVVVITGEGSVSGAVQAVRSGAVDFLEKPVDVIKMVEVAEIALERRKQALENLQKQQAQPEQALKPPIDPTSASNPFPTNCPAAKSLPSHLAQGSDLKIPTAPAFSHASTGLHLRPPVSASPGMGKWFLAGGVVLLILAGIAVLLKDDLVQPGWEELPPVAAVTETQQSAQQGFGGGMWPLPKEGGVEVDRVGYYYTQKLTGYYCRHYLKTGCENVPIQLNPLKSGFGNIQDGAVLFSRKCARCHGDSGRGLGRDAVQLNFPPKRLDFAGEGVLTRDNYLFWSIAEGGGVLGTDMPAFKEQLGETEIWKLVLFVNTL